KYKPTDATTNPSLILQAKFLEELQNSKKIYNYYKKESVVEHLSESSAKKLEMTEANFRWEMNEDKFAVDAVKLEK
uniref:Transaldolase (Fragments) n=1 Tax=Carcinus maenas TaxID=6759 RepID=TALDO_CARMA|nr:RecName: Full=Transaldolase [Carcinus maenas]